MTLRTPLSAEQTSRIQKLPGVRDALDQACEAARKEFWQRIDQLIDLKNPDPTQVVRSIEVLDLKHRDDDSALNTRHSYGRRPPSIATFNGRRLD